MCSCLRTWSGKCTAVTQFVIKYLNAFPKIILGGVFHRMCTIQRRLILFKNKPSPTLNKCQCLPKRTAGQQSAVLTTLALKIFWCVCPRNKYQHNFEQLHLQNQSSSITFSTKRGVLCSEDLRTQDFSEILTAAARRRESVHNWSNGIFWKTWTKYSGTAYFD